MRYLAGFALLLTACSDGFTAYNELDRLRVLAISAQDPWLAPDQSTELSALVVQIDDRPVTYRWSWCPLLGTPSEGYPCAISRVQLQATIDEALGSGVITVPPYELGTTATATYTYSLPPEFFQAACEAIKSGEVPEFVTIPQCEGSFPIGIRLEISDGDSSITAVKEIELVYEDIELNTNPVILGGEAELMGVVVPLAEDGSTVLKRDTAYDLRLTIPETSIQKYLDTPPEGGDPVEREERLTITWFSDAGSFEAIRTGYLQDQVSLDFARLNTFTIPKAVDFPGDTIRLYFVIRDNRKGASWLARSIRLEN